MSTYVPIQTESLSSNKPPFFNGTNYSYWKVRMTIFIQSRSYLLWKVIMDGPTMPKKMVDGVEVDKPEREWREDDFKLIEINQQATNLLYCALDSNEFHRISCCSSAKEIWDMLEVTHLGIDK